MQLKKENVTSIVDGRRTMNEIRAHAVITIRNEEGGVLARITRNLVPVAVIFIEGETTKNRKGVQAFVRKVINTGMVDEELTNWKQHDRALQSQRKAAKESRK